MGFWITVSIVIIAAVFLYVIRILSWFNALWSAGTIIGALYAHRRWGAKRRNLIGELQHSTNEILQGDLQLRVDDLLAGDRFFADSTLLEGLWERYKAYAGSGVTIGLPDPKEIFSQRALCQHDDGTRLARLMPGALTGAGILGTFIGLVWGLYQMNLDTAEALQGSIHTLTSGMQTAFITSITGITCSICYSYFDQRLDNQVLAAIGDFQSALSYLVPHTTEYNLLERLAATQEKQLADFKTFASDTLVPVVVGGLRDAMSDIVTPYMDKTTGIFEKFTAGSSEIQVQGMREMADRFNASLNQATQEQMASLSEAIKEMVEWQELIKDELAAIVQQLIAGAQEQQKSLAISLELVERIQDQVPVFETLQGILAPLSEDMSQSAAALSDIASNVIELHESTREVAQKHGELEEQLSRLTREVADSAQAQKEGLDASLELAHRLQSHVPAFTELQESLAGLGADVSGSAASLSGAVANLQELHRKIEESVVVASEMQAELSLSQEEHRQNLQQELSGMKTFWESSARDLRDLHQELSTGIQTFTKQLHDGLGYSIGEFDNLLTDVTTRLGVVISAMSHSVEDIPDEMNRVVGALYELRGTLESAIADIEQRLGTNTETEQHISAEPEMSRGKGG